MDDDLHFDFSYDSDENQGQTSVSAANSAPNRSASILTTDFASDMLESITTLALEPCGPCQKKGDGKVQNGSWYCRECDDILCHDCKALHKIFKSSEQHDVISLMESCGPCEKTGSSKNAEWFCQDCNESLCSECRAIHLRFKMSENHVIVKSEKNTNERRRKRFESEQARGGEEQTAKVGQQTSPPLSSRTAKFVAEVNAKTATDASAPVISDCVFLLDSKILVADRKNKKIKLFDARLNFLREKQFTNAPMSLCLYDNSEVAVVLGPKTIVRVSVVGSAIKEKGILTAEAFILDLDYLSKSQIVLTCDTLPPSIMVYTTEGKELMKVSKGIGGRPLFDSPWYMTADLSRSRVYISDKALNVVSAFNITPNQEFDLAFTFKHTDLTEPKGVSTDSQGNIYVCGTKASYIFQVAPNGRLIKVLLSGKDGIDSPRTISFAQQGDKFVVGCGSFKTGMSLNVFSMV